MKTYTLIAVIIINIIMNMSAYGEVNNDLNYVFTGSTRIEIIKHEHAIQEKYQKGSFSEKVYHDVTVALHCIKRHAMFQEKLGFNEKQSDEYFMALAGNKNARSIILTAAAIALAESNNLSIDDPVNGLDPNSDEYKRIQYLIGQRIMGKYLIETYALATKTEVPDSKDQPITREVRKGHER